MTVDPDERERAVLDRISEGGLVSVGSLARDLGFSEVTIRGKLRALQDKGWISRKRGGASPALHRDILERQRICPERKNAIARAAAALVRDGDVVMIEAGTTIALIARYLSGRRDVHVVTNSTLAFAHARTNPALRITVTGGEFRRETESFVGPVALDTLTRLNVRLAFVGTDGFGPERGMTTHLMEGAEIVRAMKSRAETTVLAADSGKYGRAGFAGVLPLSAVDILITDSDLDEKAESELRGAGVSVTKAGY